MDVYHDKDELPTTNISAGVRRQCGCVGYRGIVLLASRRIRMRHEIRDDATSYFASKPSSCDFSFFFPSDDIDLLCYLNWALKDSGSLDEFGCVREQTSTKVDEHADGRWYDDMMYDISGRTRRCSCCTLANVKGGSRLFGSGSDALLMQDRGMTLQ